MVLSREEKGRVIGFLATEHYTFIHFCRFAVCSVCFVFLDAIFRLLKIHFLFLLFGSCHREMKKGTYKFLYTPFVIIIEIKRNYITSSSTIMMSLQYSAFS